MSMRAGRVRLIAVVLFALLAVGMVAASREAEPVGKPALEGEWGSMRLCVDDALARITPDKPTADLMNAMTDLCYRHLHGQGLLNDFKIRRSKFTQQTYDERILLWMVVVITISGVALAGLQLAGSFRLASMGGGGQSASAEGWVQNSELHLEQGKLSVKSSVTGLLILICSFAFFWVFVYEIFVIKPVDIDGNANAGTRRDAPAQLGPGVLIPKAAASGPAQRP